MMSKAGTLRALLVSLWFYLPRSETMMKITSRSRAAPVQIRRSVYPASLLMMSLCLFEFIACSTKRRVTIISPSISASQSSVTVSPATGLTANGTDSSTITIVIRNSSGGVLGSQNVSIAATGTGNSITPQTATTDASGNVTATLTSTSGGTKTIIVVGSPGVDDVALLATPTVEFNGGQGSPGLLNSTVSVSPASNVLANGTALSTLTATLLDSSNTPVSGKTVQFIVTGNGNTIVQPVGVTDATGIAIGTLQSTSAETKTVFAVVNPGASQVILGQTPTVQFIPDQSSLSASLSSATASPVSNVTADGIQTSTITVTVRDVNSNTVAGQSVQLASSGSNNTITQPVAVTNASGVATGTIASTTAETKTITITINPGVDDLVLNSTPTVGFVADPGAISAGLSTVVANPTTNIAANGIASSTITVTVRDTNNNPVSGQTVSIAISGSGNTVTQPAAVTDASGVTTGSIVSTVAESKTITVTVNPGGSQVVLSTTPTVTFVLDFLDSDDILLEYGEGAQVQVRQRIWDDSAATWGSETTVPSSNQPVFWVVTKNKPTGGGFEKLMGVLANPSNVPTLEVMSWNGFAWISDFSVTGIVLGNETKRGFDLVYEATSGDRMIVYSDNSNNPVYRRENSGAWSAPATVFSTPPGTGGVLWVRVVARPGTDELALVYLDANSDLHAVIWDGTSWDETNTETTLSLTMSTIADSEPFDAAYEAVSGDLLVAWGHTFSSEQMQYATKAAGTGTWIVTTLSAFARTKVVRFAPETGSNRIACVLTEGIGDDDVVAMMWDGSNWINIIQFDGTGTLDDRDAGVAWVGSSGVAVIIYKDNDTGAEIDWARWNLGAGWVLQTDVPVTGLGDLASIRMRSFKGQNKLMALFTDSNAKLWAATYNGTSWTITNGAAELETAISGTLSRPFDFFVK